LQTKYNLSENDQTYVNIGDVELTLFRSAKEGDSSDDFDMEGEEDFFFEQRSANLLALCTTLCTRVIEKSGLNWGDIDDIVLAGGSCRMPMIPKMLEVVSNRKIQRNIPGFSYDTAIAIGAAIHGSSKGTKVKDVTSKTIGVEVKLQGQPYVEHLIEKNVALPAKTAKIFKANANAVLKVYEGESNRPDECIMRGRLELGNPEGEVRVTMEISPEGVLASLVEFAPDQKIVLTIQNDDGDTNLNELRTKINSLDIRM
jgi:molecular chaperone DnaK (HSP70)